MKLYQQQVTVCKGETIGVYYSEELSRVMLECDGVVMYGKEVYTPSVAEARVGGMVNSIKNEILLVIHKDDSYRGRTVDFSGETVKTDYSSAKSTTVAGLFKKMNNLGATLA